MSLSDHTVFAAPDEKNKQFSIIFPKQCVHTNISYSKGKRPGLGQGAPSELLVSSAPARTKLPL